MLTRSVCTAGARFPGVDVYDANFEGVAGLEAVRGWDRARNTDKAVF